MQRFLRAWLLLFGLAATAPSGASELPDGTLLFLENCNSVVQRATRGEIAHVALLFHEGSDAWVYEATPAKVRRVLWADYLDELARLNHRRDDDDQIRLVACEPRPAYKASEIGNMQTYLNLQLGRRYSVKNYVRGQTYDGVHCAELASTTLNESGRHHFAECHRITPQALATAAAATHTKGRISIPPLIASEPWLVRVHRRWLGCFTWLRWSAREAWSFIW